MFRLIAPNLRRLSAAMAIALIALGATFAVASPAQASHPCPIGAGHFEQAGSYITAYRYRFCENGEDIPLSVSIERYLSPGVWETVAEGSGETTYYCDGFAYNVYRTTGTPQFPILCG